MNYIDGLIAKRLGGINFGKSAEIYKFEKIKRAKAEVKINKPYLKLIDMGVGEPDWPAAEEIVDVLYKEAGKSENRFYADNGIIEFQEAACRYLKDVYGVSGLDPHKNIIHGIGSKPILAMIPYCVVDPGDYVIMTTPGYPILGTHTKYIGGKVFELKLEEENNYFPNFENIPKEVLDKAKILYINYPNNPTGQIATKEFFERVVEY